MKNVFVLFLVLISIPSCAQKFTAYDAADLHLKDGTIKSGYAFIEIFADKILFKESKNDEKEKFGPKEVDRLILKSNGESYTFRYKRGNDRRAPRILYELIDHDNASLYVNIYNISYFGGSYGPYITEMDGVSYYLVKNRSERSYFVGGGDLTSRKHIGKFVKRHFEDCPDLVKRAKNKEFKLKDFPTVVNLYNNCSKQ